MDPLVLRFGAATFLAGGLGAAGLVFPGTIPVVARFGLALGVLFVLGRPLQFHGARQLRRGRFDLRTFVWTAACFLFAYSTLLWTWWSRRGLYFPPRLLDRDLRVSYFFEAAMALVAVGLFLVWRRERTEGRTR